ncbi:MAG: ribonuclease Z [Defluviitaleaceae bacterium]|nr:ribonuclease Z [Defluviitaleaceae bacterium]
MLDIALLGCGGMMPMPGRFLTSLFLRHNGRFALIDCGEGTQVSLRILGWGFKNIDVIMFTHFHADHITGLPGLLLTIGNSGRDEPLVLIGPKGLGVVVSGLTVVSREIPFELKIIEMEEATEFSIGDFMIKSLPLEHRTKCYAYSVTINRLAKFDLEAAAKLGVPKQMWSYLQRGEEVSHEGRTYTPDMVMGQARKGIKVAYCTDTRPVKSLPDFVRDADLFVCEGIYGDNDKIDKAREYKHMLFSEAARIAKEGEVNELWLTHYSPSLTKPEEFLYNATDIFSKTFLGFDRKNTTIKFEQEDIL